MTIGIISHPECLLHEMGAGHPEQPARLKVIEEALHEIDFKKNLKSIESALVTQEQLLRVHDPEYVDKIFRLAPQQGFLQLDPDTAMNPHTLQAALRAAGAVAQGVDLVMAGEVDKVFCNVRPPGHHAEKSRAMGFCFFNNVAIGVSQALEQHHLARVAIIDFDVHHGNGTEDIFKNEERVLLCSSFQHPFYPFSGADTQNAHIFNLPLPEGTKGRLWREQIEEKWLETIKNFRPEFIFFSAGFDAYVGDELANFCLVEDDYFWLTKQVLQVTDQSAGGRAVSVLEGGYALENLGACVAAHLRGML